MRKSLCDAVIKLNDLGLNHGATGNCSIRGQENFLISPSGLNNNSIKPDRIVEMSMSGVIFESNKEQPSTEWRFHRDIYEQRDDIQAIVHTHSVYASSLSVLKETIPQFHYMIAVSGGKEIPCAEYAMFGTQKLSNNIISALGKKKACLMANHGLIAIGASLDEAINIAEEIEHLSQLYINAKLFGELNLLSDIEMDEVLDKFKSYGSWKKE